MTTKPTLEIADIFNRYEEDYIKKHGLKGAAFKVYKDIQRCRTSELGGHIEECSDGCGYTRNAYNSCRNRHCPKCQGTKTANWILKHKEEVLPVPYFHCVFTIPDNELMPIILANKREIYDLLFRCSSETLTELARDPKWLGADIGLIAVLHTWTQRLLLHPHVHCIVPGGGFDSNGNWVSVKNSKFFIRVEVLSKMFRGKFIALLKKLYEKNKLTFFDSHKHLKDPSQFKKFRNNLYEIDWVSYVKPTFMNPESIIKYLGSYTHKIAISNYRLLEIKDDYVFFNYRDSETKTTKVTSLNALDFIHLFLNHILPNRFIKMRSYGLLSNRKKNDNLSKAGKLLKITKPVKTKKKLSWQEVFIELIGIDFSICPQCKKGKMIKKKKLLPNCTRAP